MNEMREFGEVIAAKGKMITVRFPRKTACGHCGMCAVKPNDAHVDMRMEDTIGCKTGDRVEVNISNGTVLKMSLLVYTMPLVVALIGFFIAYFCGAAEVWQLVAFVASLTVGFLALSLIDKRYALSKRGKPYLVRIISESEVMGNAGTDKSEL